MNRQAQGSSASGGSNCRQRTIARATLQMAYISRMVVLGLAPLSASANACSRVHTPNRRVDRVRVVKRQFGYTKVRFKGLMKNTAQIVTLFALANLYLARRRLLAA